MQFLCLTSCTLLIYGCAWNSAGEQQAASLKPKTSLKEGRSDVEAWYRLGRYYQGKANDLEAVQAYQQVLVQQPDHVEARNALAVLYALQGRHDLALRHLRHALRASPQLAHLHNNLGYIYMSLGYVTHAAAAFEQSLRLDPENRWARENVAMLYEKMGLYEDSSLPVSAGLERTQGRDSFPTKAPATGAAVSPAEVSKATWASARSRTKIESKWDVTSSEPVSDQGVTRLIEVGPNLFEFRTIEPTSDAGSEARGRLDARFSRHESAPAHDPDNLHIEVSNGSGIRGIARQVSGLLREKGFATARLTDRPPFHRLQTEIHYRTGYSLLAEEISSVMPNRPPIREMSNLRRDIHVRVVVGKDVSARTAHFEQAKISAAQDARG
jgi:tetratricopeptide (TPR) repeat protein